MGAESSTHRHLVVTVHGIRTFGGWQERLEALVKDAAAERGRTVKVVNYKFGYFSAFAFLSIVLRWLTVRRFRSALLALTNQQAWDRVDLVAHSFGTYLVGRALYSLRRKGCPRIDTVILAGSVLPARFRWSELVPGCVGRVVNDCGIRDNILLLSHALPRLGMAGRTGFQGMTGAHLRNRFWDFGHSGYFIDKAGPSAFMEREWVSLVVDDAEARAVDERGVGLLSSVEAFLLNNAHPLKLASYAALAALLTFWGFPYLAQQNARRLIASEKGYVVREESGTRVWFDETARPTSSLAWLWAVGPIHHLDLASADIGDGELQSLPASDSLRILKLGSTRVTGSGLQGLSRFRQLEQLELFKVPLSSLGAMPPLGRLKRLDLDGTGIQDADLAALVPLHELRDLDLSNNPIQGPGLAHLASLHELRALRLAFIEIDDARLASLPPLAALETLDLEGARLVGGGLRALRGMTRLRTLDLSATSVTGAGLEHLPALAGLRSIAFTGCRSLEGNLGAVARLPALEELWLKETSVGAAELAPLAGARRLRILALPGTKVGAGGLRRLGSLPALEELYLGATQITNEDMADLAAFPGLRKLYLPANPQIDDAGLRALPTLPQLREINLERTGTTESGRATLRRSRPRLAIVV